MCVCPFAGASIAQIGRPTGWRPAIQGACRAPGRCHRTLQASIQGACPPPASPPVPRPGHFSGLSSLEGPRIGLATTTRPQAARISRHRHSAMARERSRSPARRGRFDPGPTSLGGNDIPSCYAAQYNMRALAALRQLRITAGVRPGHHEWWPAALRDTAAELDLTRLNRAAAMLGVTARGTTVDDMLRQVAAGLILHTSLEDAKKANSKATESDRLLRNTREEMGLLALSRIMEAAGARPSKATSLCDALDDAWRTLTADGLDQAARQFGVEPMPSWSSLPDRILGVLDHIALNPAVTDTSTSASSASAYKCVASQCIASCILCAVVTLCACPE